MNAVEREPVETRVLNPTASEASYKPKQRSCRTTNLKKKSWHRIVPVPKCPAPNYPAPKRTRIQFFNLIIVFLCKKKIQYFLLIFNLLVHHENFQNNQKNISLVFMTKPSTKTFYSFSHRNVILRDSWNTLIYICI